MEAREVGCDELVRFLASMGFRGCDRMEVLIL